MQPHFYHMIIQFVCSFIHYRKINLEKNQDNFWVKKTETNRKSVSLLQFVSVFLTQTLCGKSFVRLMLISQYLLQHKDIFSPWKFNNGNPIYPMYLKFVSPLNLMWAYSFIEQFFLEFLHLFHSFGPIRSSNFGKIFHVYDLFFKSPPYLIIWTHNLIKCSIV